MSAARVVLLNPPADAAVSRDYFLGVETPENWRLPPLDLAVLSGSFGGLDVRVVDALGQGLDDAAAAKAVRDARPTAVVFLSSGATFARDGAFLARLKEELPNARFAGLGDLYADVKELAFGLQPFLDAVLLDFSGEDAARWARGELDAARNIVARGEDGKPRRLPSRRPLGAWRPATPRWELFPLESYRFPGSRGACASLLTEYGCPCACSYCPASGLGHRLRPLEDVALELEALRRAGARSLFLRDAAFGLSRERALALVALLGSGEPPLAWGCSMRVDFADDEIFARMRDAGCELVSFGVDSGDDESLRTLKKGTTAEQALAAAQSARRAGLRTHAQLLIGLSSDTRASVTQTVALARRLAVDEVSLALDSQRHAVDYRRQLLVQGLVPPESMPPDTPSATSVWQGRLGLSNGDAAEELKRARRELASRAVSEV